MAVSALPFIGALSLGIVMGWLVRYFLYRMKSFTPRALSTVVSIMLGGVVIRFLEADARAWWGYPIGLLMGFVIYTVVAHKAVKAGWPSPPAGGADSAGTGAVGSS